MESEICQRNSEILRTEGRSLEQSRLKIKKLNQEIVEFQQQELCNELNAARPILGKSSIKKSELTEYALISNEVEKQQTHFS
ncbi:hypothetical protein CAXC1_110010 [Candidatus Xenohaliotis californiensis]|uniref:Uncharacterized protein n=1 Tax=Candidatus Xenohaliotis californiensis TaxID=84677 RepID=A0ABP0EST7_9RICK|nr:hypothetical protein CAXC1_110010 [Candidatus Xenohaliotis californiensis]